MPSEFNTYVGHRTPSPHGGHSLKEIGIIKQNPIEIFSDIYKTHRVYSYNSFIRPSRWNGEDVETGIVLLNTKHDPTITLDIALAGSDFLKYAFDKEFMETEFDPTATLARLQRQFQDNFTLEKMDLLALKTVLGPVTDKELYQKILNQK